MEWLERKEEEGSKHFYRQTHQPPLDSVSLLECFVKILCRLSAENPELLPDREIRELSASCLDFYHKHVKAVRRKLAGCHIGYVHMDELKLYEVFGEGVLERIPAGRV